MTVAPANTSSIIVAVTGVLQDPSTYSVSGTTLTFSAAPPSGTSNISVRYLGIPASGVTTTAYRTVTNTTATAGQTSFTIPSYTVGYVDVYRNGVYLPTSDYTATTGTTVVLNNAATVGDTITTISFYVSSVLNALPTTGGTIGGNLVITGTETVPTITSPAATALTLQTNNGTTAVTIDTSQNVGIGGTPSKKLQVTSSDVTDGIRLYSSDSGGEGLSLEWMSGYGPNRITADIESDASGAGGNFVIRVADTSAVLQNRMQIDNGGYFKASSTGSYTSGSFHNLVVNNANSYGLIVDNSNATPASQYNVESRFSASAPNNTNARFFSGYDNVGTKFTAYTNGGIGNYSANNVNLSDRMEKTNFAPAKSYLNTICSIPVQTFNYIDQNMEEDGGLTLGVVAQDVQAVAPEFVTESNWGSKENPKMRLSIYEADLKYALMKCIQELKAELDTVKAELAALKGQA
jgi:hypothetical protein